MMKNTMIHDCFLFTERVVCISGMAGKHACIQPKVDLLKEKMKPHLVFLSLTLTQMPNIWYISAI